MRIRLARPPPPVPQYNLAKGEWAVAATLCRCPCKKPLVEIAIGVGHQQVAVLSLVPERVDELLVALATQQTKAYQLNGPRAVTPASH